MEQVLIALAWIKRHHFWLLIGVVTLTGLGSWYMASAALAEDFDKNRSTIQAQQNSSRNLRNQPYHANNTINDRQRNENRQLADKVRKLWSRLYDRQREGALKWPTQLDSAFVRLVERQQFGESIPNELRKDYQNYIKNFYPELPKIVGALEDLTTSQASPGGRRTPTSNSRSTPRRDDGFEEEFLVNWSDQAYIREQLDLETTPSAIRIWVTQEDLWVYETLLRAIAAVNTAADSDRYTNAAVRDINILEVGKPAAVVQRDGDRIDRPMDEDGQEAPSLSGLANDSESDRNSSSSQGQEGEGDAALLTGRYIDSEGNPLSYDGTDDYRFGTGFKRLPVRLELRMDQRWLPNLISQLSNAPLQVEVTEVRINPVGAASGSGGNSVRRSAGAESAGAFPSEPNVVPVAMRGIVYIYNPVDEQELSVDEQGA